MEISQLSASIADVHEGGPIYYHPADLYNPVTTQPNGADAVGLMAKLDSPTNPAFKDGAISNGELMFGIGMMGNALIKKGYDISKMSVSDKAVAAGWDKSQADDLQKLQGYFDTTKSPYVDSATLAGILNDAPASAQDPKVATSTTQISTANGGETKALVAPNNYSTIYDEILNFFAQRADEWFAKHGEK